MPESPGLYPRLSVRENLECFADLYEVDHPGDRIARALSAVNLAHRAADRCGTLSKGLRQRVALARALLGDPEVLFLDEPTSGLDPVAAREVHELIAGLREGGVTIFLTTHRLEEAERLCDRVAILEHDPAHDRPSRRAARPPLRADAHGHDDRAARGSGRDLRRAARRGRLAIDGSGRATSSPCPTRQWRRRPRRARWSPRAPTCSGSRSRSTPSRTCTCSSSTWTSRPGPDEPAAAAGSGRSCARSSASTGVTGRSSSRWRSSRPCSWSSRWSWSSSRRATPAAGLSQEHLLLYMLGLPVLAAGTLAAYAIAGERQQGTLEPVLTTPIRPEELLVGKMLAVLAPSIVIAYAVFAAFLALVALFANPAVSSALLQGPDIAAQVVFTPLLAAWASWVGIAISTRSSDVRVAAAAEPAREPAARPAHVARSPSTRSSRRGRWRSGSGPSCWSATSSRLADRDAAGRSRAARDGGLSGGGAGPAQHAAAAATGRPRRCRLSPPSTPREAIARPCSSDSPSSPRTRSSARSR